MNGCLLCWAEANDPHGARASSMAHTYVPGCGVYADALTVVNRATTHPAADYCGDECPTWLHSTAECACTPPTTPHADDRNEAGA